MPSSLKKTKHGPGLRSGLTRTPYDRRADQLIKQIISTEGPDQKDANAALKKKLANLRWYQHNKDKKQEYNKKYYAENKEYWQQRYVELANKRKKQEDENYKLYDAIEAAQRSGDIAGAKQTKDYLWKQEDEMGKTWNDLKAAKTNLERATREEQDYNSSHQPMGYGDAWKSGASQIADTVKATLKKIKRKGSDL